MVALINRLLGTDIKPVHEPERPGDVKHSLADISAATRLLGYRVIVPFDQGLAKALEHYRAMAALPTKA